MSRACCDIFAVNSRSIQHVHLAPIATAARRITDIFSLALAYTLPAGAMLLLLLLLAAASAKTYIYNRNTDWYEGFEFEVTSLIKNNDIVRLNTANWQTNHTLPGRGDVVKFPASFSAFGADMCPTSRQCQSGGVVTLRPPPGSKSATTFIGELRLPLNGKVQLVGNTAINFSPSSDPVPTEVVFADYKETKTADLLCAANWIESATGKNADFATPCYFDDITFPQGPLLLVIINCPHLMAFYLHRP